MRKVVSTLFGLILAISTWSVAQAQPFDSKAMNAADKRVLQAALALEGSYSGLLDGAWGRGSQSALTKATGTSRVRWRDVSPLLQNLQTERRARGWNVFSPAFSDVSVLAPLSILEQRQARRGLALITSDRSLQIRFVPQNLAQALTLATTVASRHTGKNKLYQSLNGDRLIVGIKTTGGGVYLRTTKDSRGLTSVLIEWTDAQAARARLVIASISSGSQAGLDMTPNGPLEALLRVGQPEPKPDNGSGFWPSDDNNGAAPTNPTFDLSGVPVGSAFYINNTDLVAAASTLGRCKTLSIGDKAPVSVVARDTNLDLAVLTSPKRSADWIDISVAYPDAGDSLVVVGFEPNQLFDLPKLTAGRIVVGQRARRSSLAGKALLAQPTSISGFGSPILNQDRRLAGVMIGNPNGNRRGAFDFFASAELLRTYLKRNKIVFDASARNAKGRALTEKQLQQSVKQVRCLDR